MNSDESDNEVTSGTKNLYLSSNEEEIGFKKFNNLSDSEVGRESIHGMDTVSIEGHIPPEPNLITTANSDNVSVAECGEILEVENISAGKANNEDENSADDRIAQLGLEYDLEIERERKKISDEVFGPSDLEESRSSMEDLDNRSPSGNGLEGEFKIDKDLTSTSRSRSRSISETRSPIDNIEARSRSRSGSIPASPNRVKSRSRSLSSGVSEGRLKSPDISRSRSKSKSRERSMSLSRSRSQLGSRSRSRSKSKSKSKSVTRSMSRSVSRSRSKSGSKSRSRSKSGSKSRSRSKSGSKSRSRSKSGSKSRSRSKSVSRSRSRSKSGSRSRIRYVSRSRSRSRSGSRSRSRSVSGSKSRSRSKSMSRSRSRSKSVSRSRSRSQSSSRSRSVSRSRARSLSRSSRSNSRSSSEASPKKRQLSSGSDSDIGRGRKKVRRRTKRRSSRESSASDSDVAVKERRKGSRSNSEEAVKSRSRSRDRERAEQGTKNDEEMAQHSVSDSEDEAIRDRLRQGLEEREYANDFDMMMARKKEETMARRRRKASVDIINDNEEFISVIVRKMRTAAEQDRELNVLQKPATNKISMLDIAMSQLKKYDLMEGFLDANVLSALTDWLAPMPDKSLPSTKIREAILKWLLSLPPLNQDMLKTSGIGKAVMYLYKHPKELKENKEKCRRLIAMWSRPIFNNSADMKTLTREERLNRDLELQRSSGIIGRDEAGQMDDERPLRPGEPGWCYRARVPRPSTKDYVNRPKWQVNTDISKSNKRHVTNIEKQIRSFKEKQRQHKTKRAVKMSVEGRNMAL